MRGEQLGRQWRLIQRLAHSRAGVSLDDLATELECVLPELEPIPVPVWLVTHRELHTSRRIRLVFDLLAEGLAELASSGAAPNSGRAPTPPRIDAEA